MLPDSLLAFVATLEQAGDTAPVAVRAIRAAQSELAALVHAWLLPALPAGVVDVGGAADAPTTPIAEPSEPPPLACLRVLAQVWRHAAARPLLGARFLPAELAALLWVLHAEAPPARAWCAEEREWCAARLRELCAHEPPLPLLEALSEPLRRAATPPWLRAACAAQLSGAMQRPGGVRALLTMLSGRGGDGAAAGAQAARLLGSVPRGAPADAYVDAVGPQLIELLDAPPAADGSSDDALLLHGAAAAVAELVRRQPRAARRGLIDPLVEPLTSAGDGGARRLHVMLTAAPPPPALCDALLAPALPPLLRLLLRPGARIPPSAPGDASTDAAAEVAATARTLLALASTAVDRLAALLVGETLEDGGGGDALPALELVRALCALLDTSALRPLVAALLLALLRRSLAAGEVDVDDEGAVGAAARVAEALPALLEAAAEDDLSAALRADPEPLFPLLAATLTLPPAEADADGADDASERLELSLTLVHALLRAASDGGAAGSSRLREGLVELRPLLQCAADAPLGAAAARARTLLIGVLTLPSAAAPAAEASAEEATPSPAAAEEAALHEALQELASPLVPMRAKGLVGLRKLILGGASCIFSRFDSLLPLLDDALERDDSYEYQAAINALAAAAEARPTVVVPHLASRVADGSAPSEARMKAAQACCQVALRLGSALPPHAGALMGALLRGASDGQPEVRASSLAALAQVAATLRFSLHPWAVDLLSVVGGALACETDAQAAQAAAHILSLLLRQLGRDALTTLDARQLRACTARLRELRARAADDLVREHADAALEQLRLLGAALIFPASERRGLEIRMP